MLWKPQTKVKGGGEKNYNFMLAQDFLSLAKDAARQFLVLKKTIRQPLPFTCYAKKCKVL